MNLKKILFIVITVCFLSFTYLYAIPVNINSGNPAVPFPQFLSYAGADSLALYNPVGVPHAEMEQWVRDAYQIMANNFHAGGTVTYGGVTIPLYYFTAMLQPYFCAEGHGYALLAAAIMGDKVTFDGLWFYLNENGYFLNTLKYSTGAIVPRGKAYGKHIVSDTAGDSAADGDFDIAMAAYIAWKQWGDGTGYFAPGGTGAAGTGGYEIQYKQMAMDMMKFLVEKDEGDVNADPLYTTGDIGWDGYIKGGNTWKEMTSWANSFSPGPQFNGKTTEHIDYSAPAYFHCFHEVAQAQGLPLWDISQYARAEASSDWMMGQIHANAWLPTAGNVSMNDDGTGFTVASFQSGEDNRNSMRTHLNWLWNGPPDVSWNPVTHLTTTASNTYEKDSAIDLINFLKDERTRLGAGAGCKSTGGSMSLSFWGIPSSNFQYNPTSGAPNAAYHLNFQLGTASTAALIYGKANSNDYSVAAQIFRELTMEWDATEGTQQYLNSVPKYMHEFMRLWGMLILTGNFMSGCDMVAAANMKIYKAINKTYGFPGDKITYWLNIRNYGSLDASGVTVTDQLDSDFSYDSSTPAGSYNAGSNTVTWTFPTVSGFKTGFLNNTMRGITLVAQVKAGAAGRYCNTASVACSNGIGWTSNEYPNNQTAVMERNCIDIVPAALTITKTASVPMVNPLNTITYTISYCNSSKAGWLNGGRQGVVVCYGNDGISDASNKLALKFRLFHNAEEPWINYQNYRISYFLNDGSRKTISQTMGTSDWYLQKTIYEGGDFNGVTLTQQDLVPNSDAYGSWNMRLMIQFADQLVETTPMLERYYGQAFRIHKGGLMPLRAVWYLNTGDWGSRAWSQDWSAEPGASSADGGLYFPITNDWTDPNNPNQVINYHDKNLCEVPVTGLTQILVEEWDGYCWRRVFGNGPQPGREVKSVVITDTLPNNVTFGGFIGTTGTQTGNNLSWTIGDLLVDQCGTVKYWVTAKDPGCMTADSFIDNTAFIQGQGESPVSSGSRVTITCNSVPTATPAPASITKTANAATFNINDTITYTINYTNTYGSVIDSPLSAADAGNWSNKGTGTAMTVNGGTITSVANNNTCMTYNYSRGTNGSVTARVNIASNTVFGIAVRHLAATGHANGIYVTFKPNPPSPGEVKFWNGTTQVGTTQNLPASLGGLFDVKVVLQADTMMVYLKKTSDATFPVTPTFPTITGLPVREGFAGVINGTPANADNWGTDSCSIFHSELDTSINTLIYDPLPACVTYVGGDNSAVLNTVPNPDQVEWPLIPSLTYGSAVTYKWWGTVNCSCQNITNTAYVVPTGIASTIAAGLVVGANCGATTPTITPSNTSTKTNTSTYTSTYTITQSATYTVSVTQTYSTTPSATFTGTDTASSNTPTITITFSETSTATVVVFDTSTPVSTVTPIYSATFTIIVTVLGTITNTGTSTATATNTQTSTVTKTITNTPTMTNSKTKTVTATSTNTPTPPPVNLDISLGTSGDSPSVGAYITYTIRIVNNTPYTATNIAVWDTLSTDMLFTSNNFEIAPVQTGNYLYWDISKDSYGNPYALAPGGELTIEFVVRIVTMDASRLPLSNTVMTDYNDPFYTVSVGKHPPLQSETSFYPIGKPVVFPNPFNLDTDNLVKFDNVIPNSSIQIYTLTGEMVRSIYCSTIRATWNCTNTYNNVVSPGVYYYMIKNQKSKQVNIGKIFIVRGN